MRALLLGGAFLAFLATPARADDNWGQDIEVMSADDLDSNRGGFAFGDLNFNFGATVTTLVNGVPALVTTLTWTDVGAFVDETVGQVGQNISDMTPEQLGALGLDGLNGLGGVVIEDEAGVTALAHNITDGSLQNIIVNNATGRDLTQQIDVTLTLPGFELIQDSLVTEIFGNDIGTGPEVGGVVGKNEVHVRLFGAIRSTSPAGSPPKVFPASCRLTRGPTSGCAMASICTNH